MTKLNCQILQSAALVCLIVSINIVLNDDTRTIYPDRMIFEINQPFNSFYEFYDRRLTVFITRTKNIRKSFCEGRFT